MPSGSDRAGWWCPLSQNPQCSLLVRGPVLHGQPTGTSYSSSSILNYVNAGDCPIAHDHWAAQGWQRSLTSWYSPPTWQLPPPLVVGISSHHQGFLTWILPHISEMVTSCMHPGTKLCLGRHPRGPDAGGTLPWFFLCFAYAGGIPSLNPISPGGFSPQSPHCRGSFQATCKAGTPHYKLPWGRVLAGLGECPYLASSSHGLLHGKTSYGGWMGSEVHHVSIFGIHLKRCWHPTTILPLVLTHLFLPAFWLWQSLLFNSHDSNLAECVN